MDYEDKAKEAYERYAEIYPKVVSSHIKTFPYVKEVLKFFKDTGANSLVSYHWTPGRLKNFMLEYETRFKESDGVSLSWIPCYVKARLRN